MQAACRTGGEGLTQLAPRPGGPGRDGSGVGVEQPAAAYCECRRQRGVVAGGRRAAGVRTATGGRALLPGGVAPVVADAGMGQLQTMLAQHLAQPEQAVLERLADLGVGTAEIRAETVAIQVQA